MKSIREIFNRRLPEEETGGDGHEREPDAPISSTSGAEKKEDSPSTEEIPPQENTTDEADEEESAAEGTPPDETVGEESGEVVSDRLLRLEEGLAARGVEPERASKAAEKLRATILAILEGDLTEGILDDAMHLTFFAEEIASARREGELDGRNARIEEHIRSTLPQGNGVPRLESKGGGHRRTPGGHSIFDLAYSAK